MDNRTTCFRFAPSPTGGLHIGTARTALFNWIAARSMGGKLILRIEDTDIKRSKKQFEKSIIKDLKWLGIDWDEFFRQSERLCIYKEYAEKLVKKDLAYYCFCSAERLEILKQKQHKEGKLLKYDNYCRNLTSKQIINNINAGIPYAIRFKVIDEEIVFNDVLRGEIKFKSDEFGDFIILKSDGTPSYNFAVVIDDAEMQVTHVLRGEDHITNTARQIMLFKSLGFNIPEFIHLSMILGKDGKKLSKRYGSKTINQFKKDGYLSEALLNYLALLSWSPKKEIFLIKDVLNEFSIKHITKNPAIFDLEKLNWINSQHIRNKNEEELKKLLMKFVKKDNFLKNVKFKNYYISEKLNRCIKVYKEKLKTLYEFSDFIRVYFYQEIKNYDSESCQILKKQSSKIVLQNFYEIITKEYKDLIFKFNSDVNFKNFGNKNIRNSNITNKVFSVINETNVQLDLNIVKIYLNTPEDYYSQIINETLNKLKSKGLNIKGKDFYMPIRASLIGICHGPELQKILYILGLNDSIKRVEKALQIF